MKKLLTYGLSLFFISILILQSCKKEKSNLPLPPLHEEEWQKDQRFQDVPIPFKGDRLNLYSTDKNLYLLGPNCFDRIELNGRHQGNLIFNKDQVKFPINAELHLDYEEASSSFAFRANNEATSSVAGDFLANLDSTAITLITSSSPRDLTGTINEFNHSIFTYLSDDGPKIALIRINGNGSFGSPFKIGFTKTLPLADFDGASGGIGNPTSIDGNFFIPTSSGVFKLDSMGNLQKVLSDNAISQIFDAGDWLGAKGSNSDIYISTDNGITWQLSPGFPETLNNAYFQMIGDSIIAYNENMYTLSYSNSQWEYRLLEMDSLQKPYITGIAEFNDTIFVATLHGVYKKSELSFYK